MRSLTSAKLAKPSSTTPHMSKRSHASLQLFSTDNNMSTQTMDFQKSMWLINKANGSKHSKENKKRKAEDSAADEEQSKSIKTPNVAFNNSMGMDLHIYTVR